MAPRQRGRPDRARALPSPLSTAGAKLTFGRAGGASKGRDSHTGGGIKRKTPVGKDRGEEKKNF